jgi:hypothetical protein
VTLFDQFGDGWTTGDGKTENAWLGYSLSSGRDSSTTTYVSLNCSCPKMIGCLTPSPFAVDQVIDLAVYSDETSPEFSWEIMYLAQVVQNGHLLDSYNGAFNTHMEFSYAHSTGTLSLLSKSEGRDDGIDQSDCSTSTMSLVSDLSLKGWSITDTNKQQQLSAKTPYCFHTQLPTLTPSSSPTFVPSVSPFVVPTYSPSGSPSTRPTRLPSTSPTTQPSPVFSLSSSPSASPISMWADLVDVFTSTLFSASVAQLLFSDFSLNNHQEMGCCVEWSVLLQDQVPTTLINHVPVALSVFAMSGDEMLRLSDRSDSVEVASVMRRVRCEDSSVLVGLLADLQAPHPSHSKHVCGVSEWSVLTCAGPALSSSPLLPVLCVNCSSIVSGYCDLSATDRSRLWSSLSSPASGAQSLFSISCSDAASDAVGRLSMLFVEFDERFPPPSFVSLEVMSVTDTSVEVNATMSGSGYLLCGSYLASFSVSSPSSSELSFGRAQVATRTVPSSSTSFASYSLTGLTPSSSYNIYCTTLSLTSVPMSTESMLKMSVVTKCCRLLSVVLSELVVDDVSVVGFALRLALGGDRVVGSLTVSVSGSEVSSLARREMFVPSFVSFSSSLSLSSALTYVPVPPGTYRLSISLSGSASGDYKVVFPVGDVLVVKGVEEALSAPLVQRSQFSSDGSKVTVTFTSPTNGAGALNCGLLFSLPASPRNPFSTVSSSSSFRCVWKSASSLEISSSGSSSSSLRVGSVWLLRRGMLKARCTSQLDSSCSTWSSNEPQNVTMSAPSAVQAPVVTILIASVIGPCADLIVDLTSSMGSGGRAWESVSFLVLGSSPNVSLVQDFLNSVWAEYGSSSTRSPFSVPHGFLSSGYGYTLEVRLCNFLGGCGSRVKSFVVSSSSGVPVAVLNSQSQISIFRNSTLSISGDGYTSNCGVRSRSYLTYSWSLFQPYAAIAVSASLRSLSVNPLEFRLPSYSLSVGALYIVQLTVRHSISMKISSVSVEVFVQPGDLRCVLFGEEFGLRLDGSVLLDGSGSSDSDVDLKSADYGAGSLLFEWSCFQISPFYRGDCTSLIFSSLTSSLSQAMVTVNSSSSSPASASDVFKIAMRGRAMSVEDSRRCEKIVTLSLLAPLSPVVRLAVLSLSGSGSKFNPSSKLKISGRVEMPSRGHLVWSVSDASIDLLTVSLSPASLTLPASASGVGSVNVLSLVVAENSLPHQSLLIFTLKCSLDNGYSSSSSVTVTTNSPPFGGVLEVSPLEGVILNTTFLMIASDWSDEDLPLSYQFGYLSSSSSSSSSSSFSPYSSDLIMLRSQMQLSFTSTLLPAVSSCAMVVFDQLDSSSQYLSDVSVREGEASMSASQLRVFLTNGINLSHETNNPEDLKRSLSLTSTVLNRVDCSSAPNCESLNRLSCSSMSVEGTCGPCLSGFVGLLGPSNTICSSSSERLQLSSSSRHPCVSHGDCAEALFLECNLESKFCQSIQQSCPNSCSGHGRCVFVSKYDVNVSVSECGVLMRIVCLAVTVRQALWARRPVG